MKLEKSQFMKFDKYRLVELLIIVAFALAGGWCVWFFIDINKRISEPISQEEISQVKIDVGKINSLKDYLKERRENFEKGYQAPKNPF